MFSALLNWFKSFGKDKAEESVAEKSVMLAEAPIGNKSLEEMTKEELDALGEQNGIKLDRRKKKATLISTLKEHGINHG